MLINGSKLKAPSVLWTKKKTYKIFQKKQVSMRDKRHKKLHFVYFDAIFLFFCEHCKVEQNVEHIFYEHLISQEERET